MGSGQSPEEPEDPRGLFLNRSPGIRRFTPCAGDNYFMEDAGEQRFQIIGMTRNLVLLLVVFVEPGSDVIRIVSARKAVEYEKSIYEDQFR